MFTVASASADAGTASANRARMMGTRRRKRVPQARDSAGPGRSFSDRVRVRSLAADGGHRPCGLAEAFFAHVMLQLLAPHGVADDRLDFFIRGPGAQWVAQVGLVQR